MVLMISSADSGEEASSGGDWIEGGGGGVGEGGGGSEEDVDAIAVSMLQQGYGQVQGQKIYSAAGPRRFEAFLFGRDDFLLYGC